MTRIVRSFLAALVVALVPLTADAAITSAVCNIYKTDVMKGVFRSADSYRMALYQATANLDQSTTAYTATGEASGTNYTAGGATMSGFGVTLSTNTAQLDFADVVWSNASVTARGAMIYDTTAATNGGTANACVAVVNFGSDVSSTAADFTVTVANAVTITLDETNRAAFEYLAFVEGNLLGASQLALAH